MSDEITGPMEAIRKLDADLKAAAKLLGRREARYLVDQYYVVQDQRIRADAQVRSSEGEPNRLLSWDADTHRIFEANLQRALDVFAKEYRIGLFLQSICGIGPVISAGLLTHFDVTRAPTVSNFWSFSGLNPQAEWKKGEKRPWCADAKTLTVYKAGESFVKVQSNKNDVYGHMFREKRDQYEAMNQAGVFADAAHYIITGECKRCTASINKFCSVCHGRGNVTPKRLGKDTEAYGHYSAGRLPPAHLHARARRYTVKIFLSHVHHVMFRDVFGKEPPKPYIFDHPEADTRNGTYHDHRHFIEPPVFDPSGHGKSLTEMKV